MRTGTLFDLTPEGTFAEVAVPVPAPGPFTYFVPGYAADMVLPGSRVIVPFSGRRLNGVVVATRSQAPEAIDAAKIRPLADCLDPVPLLSPVLLALTRWIADETMSSWGEAIRTALPSGVNKVSRRRVALTPQGLSMAEEAVRASQLPKHCDADEWRLIEALRTAKGRGMSLGALAKRAAEATLCARLYAMAERGLVEIDDEWAGGVGGRWRDLLRPVPHFDLEAARARTTRAPAQRRAVEVLWERNPLAAEELCAAADCTRQVVNSLIAKGVVETRREAIVDDPSSGWEAGPDGAGSFTLTPAQAQALASIDAASAKCGFHAALLYGVTGSGKTEIYLRAARKVIDSGRTAILLVPEIGLTPLLASRAVAVLGDAVGVMHSGLSEGERLSTWWRARSGNLRAIIGPRSALFAPLDNVGLIIVDEEQDGAYKQDETPRYHGREAALERGRLEGAVVVMGSATPAVETFWAAEAGHCEILSMPARVADRPLPEVALVDMRAEWKTSGRSLLSEELEQAIEDCLQRGDQALLLLNRRGFAASLRCRICGERIPCPDCSVSLTLHRRQRQMRCHYCDFTAAVPDACPVCDAEAMHELGHGTQQLEEALGRRFPSSRIGRFDADETRRKGAHARILSMFGRGDIDVLVGTQMLAKGHDFPGVTLVGAVGADDSLGLPDFRAAERTFQLLTQMAGRAGRGDAAGRVILQAYQPHHYAIACAVGHDYTAFYRQEIEYRRRLAYPPFASLISCVCRGKTAIVVREEADHLAAALRMAAGPATSVLGPASPPLAKLRGMHRIRVLLRGPDIRELRGMLKEGLDHCRTARTMPRDLKIDVQPLNLM